MSAVQFVNSNAEVLKKFHALSMNINAAVGLQEVMKSNLGPKGTLKMLVSAGAQIKLTKDGNVLLHEMQIQHPTASMIARAATAQDDNVGDGTTSNVLFIGELMKQAERLIKDGIHPRIIVEGFDLAKSQVQDFLCNFKIGIKTLDKVMKTNVARTSLMTKLHPDLANLLIDIVVDAVDIVTIPDSPIDLHMVEIMHMKHKMATSTRLVKGLVLDHGGRHANMPKRLEKCYILTCNVSLEYEGTEVHSQFFWSSAEQRDKLQRNERWFADDKCSKIIELKKKVCDGTDKSFVVINQKGIDPICLDMLAKENIIALRRAKRRNMERLILACGGNGVNSVDELTEEDLGYADEVYEHSVGEEKYTFVEGVKNPKSCTILINGPNEHTIAMIKEATRDGLRAIKNLTDDMAFVPGAGSFEIAAYDHLMKFKEMVSGKTKLGVQAYAESLLIIPKVLAENSGYDTQDMILTLHEEYQKKKVPVGINVLEYGTISPDTAGIIDNFCVKKEMINICTILVQQLLLVDEIMKAGKSLGGDKDPHIPNGPRTGPMPF